MPLVKCKECGNEISTKADACPKCGAKVIKTHIVFKIIGVILILMFIILAIDHKDNSIASVAASTPQTSSVTSPTPAAQQAEAQGEKQEPWEPIGKYSQKEINLVSDAVGKMFAHMQKMDAIESRVTRLLRNGYRAVDEEAMMRAVTNYSVDAVEESEKIDQIDIPDIENVQAYSFLFKAKTALVNASQVQKDRASRLAEIFSGGGDSDAISNEIKELDVRRTMAIAQFVGAYAAYESYGFTSAQIDDKTGRLKKNAKPDREDAASSAMNEKAL